MRERVFDVYVHPRKGRPRRVAASTTAYNEIVEDGTTYYFATMDLSRKTITYSEVKPVLPVG